MANEDLIDLLLRVARQQQNIVDVREDEVVDKLKSHQETITLDDLHSTSLKSHPIKWGLGGNNAKWGFFTWG